VRYFPHPEKGTIVIYGAHVITFSCDVDGDRDFIRDVLEFDSVDVGDGWLFFALPPAELAFHPGDSAASELYFMCEDVEAEIVKLEAKGVICTPIDTQQWGRRTMVRLPSGMEMGIYEPTHPTLVQPPI
jgi:hypothetical protein